MLHAKDPHRFLGGEVGVGRHESGPLFLATQARALPSAPIESIKAVKEGGKRSGAGKTNPVSVVRHGEYLSILAPVMSHAYSASEFAYQHYYTILTLHTNS